MDFKILKAAGRSAKRLNSIIQFSKEFMVIELLFPGYNTLNIDFTRKRNRTYVYETLKSAIHIVCM